MSQPPSDIFVSTHDLQIGIARSPCPYCRQPLIIRLPSMADAIDDRQSQALRLGLYELTATERQLFDQIYLFFPRAVTVDAVCKAMDNMLPATVREHVFRMRPKLIKHGWTVINWHSALRLIEPQPIIDVDA